MGDNNKVKNKAKDGLEEQKLEAKKKKELLAQEETQDDYQYKMELYKSHINERNKLISFEFQTIKQIDQTLLTISSVTLSLTITFIKFIGKNPKAIWSLKAAWLLFGGTIACTFFSLVASYKAHRIQVKNLDIKYRRKAEGREEQEKTNNWTPITQRLNFFSGLFFLFAWVALGYFVLSNLQ
ncbi:MAG: hypothetical protein AB1814_14265 [Thermodesulfobacteriota bacterium]